MYGSKIHNFEAELILKRMKSLKAAGCDNLSTKVIKCTEIPRIIALFNRIYHTGIILQDGLEIYLHSDI